MFIEGFLRDPKVIGLYFAGFLDLLLGIFVFLKNTKSQKNFSFFLFSLAISFWSILVANFLVVKSLVISEFLMGLIVVIIPTISITFYHLSYSFSNKHAHISTKTIKSLYMLIPIILLTQLIYPKFYIKEIIFHNWGKESIVGLGYYAISIFYALLVISGFYKIFKTFKNKNFTKKEISINRYLFTSLLIAFIFGSIFNWLLTLLNNDKFIWVGPYSLLIVIITITYAITKHHLMDIRIIIKKTALYSILGAIVVAVFAGVV